MNITKDGIEVKAGQTWQDLDKRMKHRTIVIDSVGAGRAYYSNGGRRGSVRIDRMHKHSTGFALVDDVAL